MEDEVFLTFKSRTGYLQIATLNKSPSHKALIAVIPNALLVYNNVSLNYDFYFISIFHKDCDSVKCEVGNKCVLGQFVPQPTCSVDCQEDFIWVLDEKGMKQ